MSNFNSRNYFYSIKGLIASNDLKFIESLVMDLEDRDLNLKILVPEYRSRRLESGFWNEWPGNKPKASNRI